MRHDVWWLVMAGLLTSAAARGTELTIERLFTAPNLSGPSLRALEFSPDGRRVTYLQGAQDDKDRFDLWEYNLRERQARLLVDSRRLVPQEGHLSPEEEARRERQRISALKGIVEYSFSDDSRSLLFPLGGDLYVYDLSAPAARAVRRLTDTAAYETDARFSPRGRYVSFIRDQDLFIYDLREGRELALTGDGEGLISNGMAEFIAQEEMDRDTGYWWAPDDSRIAYARVDETPVNELERIEIFAEDVQVVRQRYPATGTPNAKVDLFVASADGDERVRIDLGDDVDVYVARVDWFPDGRSLLVQRQSRDQKRLDLLKVDVASGRSRLLFSETSEHWVELNNELTLLKGAGGFIWASQRSGFQHLYLYDDEGRQLRPLTTGSWMVLGTPRAIVAVDEPGHRVYFTADRDGYSERHLYAARLDGRAVEQPVRITQERGWHDVKMSRDARHFVDTFSSVDQPPQVSLRDSKGRRLAWLLENRLDTSHPYAPYLADHARVEFGTLAADDGTTLHWQLMKPRDFDAGRRYPVVVYVYGGPHGQMVANTWQGRTGGFAQYLVRQGYLVFSLDNRGAGRQGLRSDSALQGRMASVEVEDQIAGAKYLASLPYVDPQRIGVFGWSYGGYMALHLMFRAGEHFRAGVAGAPVTDWRLYDTHYTERYMGTPQANPAGYEASSVFPYLNGLGRPLLILHGMADDNVLFTNSTKLFKALQDANKPFEMMVYPGHKHGLLAHADAGPHAYATIARFFERQLGKD